MKILMKKELATHFNPESCVEGPRGPWRSVDRGCAGMDIELRKHRLRVSTSYSEGEDHTVGRVLASVRTDSPESETHGMSTNLASGKRETHKSISTVPVLVRSENAVLQNAGAHDLRESDQCIRPEKRVNKGSSTGLTGQRPAESVEGKTLNQGELGLIDYVRSSEFA